jgi:hypothetical protein
VRNRNGKKKLIIIGAVLALSLIFAFVCPDLLIRFFTFEIIFFRVYHVIWLLTVALLVKRMFPRFNRKISSGKIFEKHYADRGNKNPSAAEKLRIYRAKTSSGAAQTAVYWTVVVIATGMLYYFNVLRTLDIYLVVIFFIFMDQFCTSVWCPFQWLIGNKCCNSCRINNWGYLMAFAPFIYLPSFWTYSVLALSAVVVIQWEYLFHKHPERFFELYNTNLMCRNCSMKCKQG